MFRISNRTGVFRKVKRHNFKVVIFDLDGVVTGTARLHARAWKTVFDDYLRLRERRDKEPFKPFTHENDYLPYVDGKPRYKGVDSFLRSRGIAIPFGDPQDSPEEETTCGLGNKKNLLFQRFIKEDGADVYQSTVDFIRELKKEKIRVGVASSSKNCQLILSSAGLEDLFATRVDGVISAELKLKGKPEGDIFVRAASNLGVEPGEGVVVEDAVSGVQAGRNGAFGLVLGIAREKNAARLFANGADLVVEDLSLISIDDVDRWFSRRPRPADFTGEAEDDGGDGRINPEYNLSLKDITRRGKPPVFFLDYDGTLTPIVDNPSLAVMSDEMRQVIIRLSSEFFVAVVSGREREEVESLVKIKGIFYAGSHGFDIAGPGKKMILEEARQARPRISRLVGELKEKLGGIEGVLLEEKKFSIAVHYRLVKDKDLPAIKEAVKDGQARSKDLRLLAGKKVFEFLPAIDWHKGRAVRWLMEAMNFSYGREQIFYIGDDVTDEYAFRQVRCRGAGILVCEDNRISAARFYLKSQTEVKAFFEEIIRGK